MSTPRILCPGCGRPVDPARTAADAAHVIECTARAAASRDAEERS